MGSTLRYDDRVQANLIAPKVLPVFEPGQYGGIRWLAGVELWVVNGELRARAAEPLDVSLILDQVASIEIVLRVDEGGQATVSSDPTLPSGSVVYGPSEAPITVNLNVTSGSLLRTVRVTGNGVGILSCSVTRIFVPGPPAGLLRITDIRLPTASQTLDHELVMMAMDAVTLDGYTLHCVDALSPGASQLYVSLPRLTLRGGQRLRLVPGRTSASVSDDALVCAGGAVTSPPNTGAIYQLLDPTGKLVHEYAALPSGQSNILAGSLTAIPNSDGTRAFLIPPLTAQGITHGHWVVNLELSGDVGPDLDRWSIAGIPIKEKAQLAFSIV